MHVRKNLSAAATLLLLFAFNASAQINIIFVMIDELNKDSLGSPDRVATHTTHQPHAPARSGLRYHHADAAGASYTPLRNVIRSAMHLNQKGMLLVSNGGFGNGDDKSGVHCTPFTGSMVDRKRLIVSNVLETSGFNQLRLDAIFSGCVAISSETPIPIDNEFERGCVSDVAVATGTTNRFGPVLITQG
jgi:hypothetical protein